MFIQLAISINNRNVFNGNIEFAVFFKRNFEGNGSSLTDKRRDGAGHGFPALAAPPAVQGQVILVAAIPKVRPLHVLSDLQNTARRASSQTSEVDLQAHVAILRDFEGNREAGLGPFGPV